MKKNINRVGGVFVLVLGFFVLGISQAQATDYYVAPTGADTNPGTLASPWKTIGKANAMLKAGDTVFLRGGTYTNQVISPSNSGTESSRITYTNYGKEVVTITGSDTPMVLDGRKYITITGSPDQNIIMTNCDKYLKMTDGDYNYFSYLTIGPMRNFELFRGFNIGKDSSYNWVHHCNVFDYGEFTATNDRGDMFYIGAEFSGDCSHNLIENNHIYHGGHNVFCINAKYNVVRNNYFHSEAWKNGNGGRLAEIRHSTGGNTGDGSWNLIEGNRWGYSSLPPDADTARGIKLVSPDNIVRKNMFYNLQGAGLVMVTSDEYQEQYTVDNYIYNNVFFNNGLGGASEKQGILFLPKSSGGSTGVKDCVVKNNVFYKNLGSDIAYNGVGSINNNTIENNWLNANGNPLFKEASTTKFEPLNQTSPNFELQSGSPCIDKAAFLTYAVSAGSGTQLKVQDAHYFMDGWGMGAMGVSGDVIQLKGQTQTAKITKVDYANNLLTLDKSLAWSANQGVSLAYQGTAPDMGAHESGETALPPPPPPPPATCKLTSAVWSQTKVTEGAVVQLNTQAEGCDGKTFNYTIKEDDGLGILDDTITSFESNTLAPNWTTIYATDQLGGPEYYFEVYEVGNELNKLTSDKNSELIVEKKTEIPVIDLIATYDFNEADGMILNDSVGGYNGNINNATRIEGYEGNALKFDGSGQGVEVPYNLALTPQKITVAFWMRTGENTALTDWNSILNGAGGTGYSSGWRILDDQNSLNLQVNFGPDVPVSIANTSTKLVVNKWVHVAFTYDGNNIKLYQDGVEIATKAETGSINWLPSDSMQLAFNANGKSFNGALDNLKIYGRALSASEVNELYACRITSASWSKVQAFEGDVVSLDIQSQNCKGKVLNYTIREDDWLSLHDDVVASFSSVRLNPNWTTIYVPDQVDGPEYFFEVYDTAKPQTIIKSTVNLQVEKRCADNDGDGYDICEIGVLGSDEKTKDCDDNNISINPGITEKCANGIDENCDGKDDACPDGINPKIYSFFLQENAGKVDINWGVTDNAGLSRVKVWRTIDKGVQPSDSDWGESIFNQEIDGTSASGVFNDAPADGKWLYKLKVFDRAGNQYEQERQIEIPRRCEQSTKFICDKDNLADLCAGRAPSAKVDVKATCNKITTTTSCDKLSDTVSDGQCNDCKDGRYTCKILSTWKEVAP